MSKKSNITECRRYAEYIDADGTLNIIQVASTETEEQLQQHFECTIGKRLNILGFFWNHVGAQVNSIDA